MLIPNAVLESVFTLRLCGFKTHARLCLLVCHRLSVAGQGVCVCVCVVK